jgi:protein-L-isoaspartate(D-aspartate) O-methyltransferase
MAVNPHSDLYAVERYEMVEQQLRSRGIRDSRVLAAMTRVPRHEFVADTYRAQAYDDHPIPIGENQTISQPYIVAITLAALSVQPIDIILEIGTGSGYQTALLAELAHHVYSIERHASLAQRAENTLRRLGYHNLTVVIADGSQGLAQQAPFDAIAVSAAAPHIPPPLFEQLCEAGRMVIPVGPEAAQQLQLVSKIQGAPVVTVLEPCRFVPLIGSDAYPFGWK